MGRQPSKQPGRTRVTALPLRILVGAVLGATVGFLLAGAAAWLIYLLGDDDGATGLAIVVYVPLLSVPVGVAVALLRKSKGADKE